MTPVFILTALIAYIIAAVMLALYGSQTVQISPNANRGNGTRQTKRGLLQLGLLAAGIGILAHGLALVWQLGQFDQSSEYNLHQLGANYFQAVSLLGFGVALVVWLTSLARPAAILGVIIYPVAGFVAVAPLAFVASNNDGIQASYPISNESLGHVLMGIVGFGFFTAAAVQALVLAWQNRRLRHPQPGRLTTALPPLETMESLLFGFVWAGFITLSGILLSGLILTDDLMAQHLLHKAVLSVIVWCLFAALLIGRIRFGWRGLTAVRYTLIGYAILLVAYFGSKLVLELILGQHWG